MPSRSAEIPAGTLRAAAREHVHLPVGVCRAVEPEIRREPVRMRQPTRAVVGDDGDEDSRADRQRLAVPIRLACRHSNEHGCGGPQPNAVEQGGAHEGKLGEAADRARPAGRVGRANLGEGALTCGWMRREQRQRIEDRGPNGVERHQPERHLAVRPCVVLRGRGREQTDERAGLGGGDIPLDPCVHGRLEPCVPASTPDLEPQPVGVRTQSAVLLAQLRVVRGRIAQGTAPRDPSKPGERPLVVEDVGVRQHRPDLFVDNPQELLREAMGIVSVVKDGLVERAALGMELRR